MSFFNSRTESLEKEVKKLREEVESLKKQLNQKPFRGQMGVPPKSPVCEGCKFNLTCGAYPCTMVSKLTEANL